MSTSNTIKQVFCARPIKDFREQEYKKATYYVTIWTKDLRKKPVTMRDKKK